MILQLPLIAEQIVSIAAGFLMILAQITLILDVFKRKISPSLLSWIGWSFLMGTSFIAQIISKGWQWNLVGLGLSILGCLIIFFCAWSLNQYSIKKHDRSFLFLGFLCMLIYLISKNPWYTTSFAVLADFIVGIPTLILAWKNPISQKTFAWKLGFLSWAFSLLLCIGYSWLYALFPIYLFLYNGAMILLTNRKIHKVVPSASMR